MSRAFRSLTSALAISAVALGAAACAESAEPGGAATGSGTATGDIKIGAVLDITGAGASLGSRSGRRWRCWPRR